MDKLPRATQDGKNTAGCLVDDHAWVASTVRSIGSLPAEPVSASWFRSGSYLTLLFNNSSNNGTGVYFLLKNVRQPATFVLDQAGTPSNAFSNPSYGSFERYDTYTYFLTGPDAPGTLTITRFDTTANVVSGTFEFTGRSRTGETVQVRRGRFDALMEKYN